MTDVKSMIESGAVQTVGDLIADDLVLVFDTETTGLPLWSQPSDHPDQPHIVQLAAELCRSDGTVIETMNEIVNIGVPIPPDMTAIHGIDDARAAQGIAPTAMLERFLDMYRRAALVIAYNKGFDLRMVRMQCARHMGFKWECEKPTDDPMWIVAKHFGIAKPKLTDAVRLVFEEAHDSAHCAMADTTAARRIYFEMVRRGYVASNPRAAPGGNNPPPDPAPAPPEAPADFASIQKEIEGLYEEAKNWLDGDPIETEGQASEIAKLRDMIRDAENRAEKMRKEEAKPFDDGKAEVQGRYNPLIQKDRGKTALALKACNSALAPYLRKVDEQQRAIAVERQRAAEAEAMKAREAAMAAAQSSDLAQRESAEQLIAQASAALKDAKRADAAKPQVQGGKRAVGLKTVYHPELVDPAKAIEHYRQHRPAALKEWMLDQAKADVKSGQHAPDAIPGFIIRSEQVPV